MAWYGTNRRGAYIRVCQTDPKVQLQSSYMTALLKSCRMDTDWCFNLLCRDDAGDGFVVSRSKAPLPEAALSEAAASGQDEPTDAVAASNGFLRPSLVAASNTTTRQVRIGVW